MKEHPATNSENSRHHPEIQAAIDSMPHPLEPWGMMHILAACNKIAIERDRLRAETPRKLFTDAGAAELDTASTRSEKQECEAVLAEAPGIGVMKWCEKCAIYFGKDQPCPSPRSAIVPRELAKRLNDAAYKVLTESNGIFDNEWRAKDGVAIPEFPVRSFTEAIENLSPIWYEMAKVLGDRE